VQALPVSRQLQNRESKTGPGDRSRYPRRTSAFREWRRIQHPENGAERAVCATSRNSERETRLVGCGCSPMRSRLHYKSSGKARRNALSPFLGMSVWSPWNGLDGTPNWVRYAAAKLLGLNRCRQSKRELSEVKRRALALADNKIAENAASCWPSSCPSSPSPWCSKASTLRSPGRKSSAPETLAHNGLVGGSNPPSPTMFSARPGVRRSVSGTPSP
jgi:hypothetical protein